MSCWVDSKPRQNLSCKLELVCPHYLAEHSNQESKQVSILDLSDRLDAGVLFRPPDDKLRVEASIPPLGRQSPTL